MSLQAAPHTDTSPTRGRKVVVHHYARKADITASIVLGIEIPALCGEWFVPHSQGNGTVSTMGRPGSVLCDACGVRYDRLPA